MKYFCAKGVHPARKWWMFNLDCRTEGLAVPNPYGKNLNVWLKTFEYMDQCVRGHKSWESLCGFYVDIDHLPPHTEFPPNWTLAHIVHAAGMFKSVAQARKNGWDNKPIPSGSWDFCHKKNGEYIFVLNPEDKGAPLWMQWLYLRKCVIPTLVRKLQPPARHAGQIALQSAQR